MMTIVAIGVSIFLITGAAAAIPFDGNGDGYFYLGEFKQCETGGIEGTYVSSGLTGCTISVFAADGTHLLDIMYATDHIDIAFQVLKDTVLEQILEKEEWLEQYIQNIAFQLLSFEKPEIKFTYENCTVEMHDSSISFLKIITTGSIVLSGLEEYTVNCTSACSIELAKDDFSSTIMGDYPLQVNNDSIIGQGTVMIRGMDMQPLCGETAKIKTVEGAIKTGVLGGEITVVKNGKDYLTDTVSYYNNVTIRNETLSRKQADFIISGDHHTTGKTVKINIGQNVFSTNKLEVLFDGEPISLADDLEDVLNPNDDGLQPEYVMVNVTAGGGDEFFLLVSVPHFSEHRITLRSVIQNPVFFAIAAVSAIALVMVASWAMFRKK